MTVAQLARWLQSFHDQEATVEVLSYDEPDGTGELRLDTIAFDSDNDDCWIHTNPNEYVDSGHPEHGKSYLLLGKDP